LPIFRHIPRQIRSESVFLAENGKLHKKIRPLTQGGRIFPRSLRGDAGASSKAAGFVKGKIPLNRPV
jgi:hypothetical protein